MTDLAIMEYNATQRGEKRGEKKAEKRAEARMRKMAKGLRDKNVDVNIISETTGLSVEEIKAL